MNRPLTNWVFAFVIVAIVVAVWFWLKWPLVPREEIGIAIWLGLVCVSFLAAYGGTAHVVPRSRRDYRALLKATIRAFPWAFLFTPSMAFGAIALPMPAGLLVMGWLWQILSRQPHVQGPQNATGPFAVMALLAVWAALSVAAVLTLKTKKNA